MATKRKPRRRINQLSKADRIAKRDLQQRDREDIKRAAIYWRCSTDPQTAASEKRQLAAIERFCQDEGLVIVKRYADPGVSGLTARKRPEWYEMHEAAKRGEFDVVVVEEASRYSRQSGAKVLGKLGELAEVGVWFASVRDNGQCVNISGEYSDTILSLFAARSRKESINLSNRVSGTKRDNYLNGIDYGKAPWGFDVEYYEPADHPRFHRGKRVADYRQKIRRGDDEKKANKDWQSYFCESDDERSDTVRKIFAMFLEGVPPKTIAEALNEEGIPSPSGVVGGWHRETIRNTLKSEKYAGATIIGKTTSGRFHNATERQKPTSTGDGDEAIIVEKNPNAKLVWGYHEALVSRRDWEKVQRLIAGRKKTRRRAPRSTSLLTGIARCPFCGGPMCKGGTRGEYYQCSRTVVPTNNELGCKKGGYRIKVELLDAQVRAAIRQAFGLAPDYQGVIRPCSDEFYDELKAEGWATVDPMSLEAATLNPSRDEKDPDGAQLAKLERELASKQAQKVKWAAKYENARTDGQRDRADDRIADLEEDIAAIEMDLEQFQRSTGRVSQKQAQARWDELARELQDDIDPKRERAILEQLVERVQIFAEDRSNPKKRRKYFVYQGCAVELYAGSVLYDRANSSSCVWPIVQLVEAAKLDVSSAPKAKRPRRKRRGR